MMIKQLAHLCILTSDLAGTADFYTRGLGLRRVFDFEKDGSLFGYYLDCGRGSFIEVFRGTPGQPGSIIHLCLEVEDIDAAVAAIRGRGIHVGDKKKGTDGNFQAWLEDPNGVRIELMQYLPGRCQETGKACIVNW